MYGRGFGLPWLGGDVDGGVYDVASVRDALSDPDVPEARRVAAVHQLLRATWRDLDEALPVLVHILNEPLVWLTSEVLALLVALPSTFAVGRWLRVGDGGFSLWRGTPMSSREGLFVDDGNDSVFAFTDALHAALSSTVAPAWACVDVPTWLLTTMRMGHAPVRHVLALPTTGLAWTIDDGVVLHLTPAATHGEVRHTRPCVVDGAMLPGTATERVGEGSVVQTHRHAVRIDAHLRPTRERVELVRGDDAAVRRAFVLVGQRAPLQRGHVVAIDAQRIGVVDTVGGDAWELQRDARIVLGIESVVWRDGCVRVLADGDEVAPAAATARPRRRT